MDIGILIVIGIVALVVIYGITAYNRFIAQRQEVRGAWADIDTELRRRYDLVPNLVETVKGYASHERETFEAVISARNAGVSASTPHEQAEAENMITGALGRLFALQEAYPELKADQNFRQLQEELTATEDRVAYARQFYNDQVRSYNTSILQFPAVLIARLASFTPREFFEVDDATRAAPRVEF